MQFNLRIWSMENLVSLLILTLLPDPTPKEIAQRELLSDEAYIYIYNLLSIEGRRTILEHKDSV